MSKQACRSKVRYRTELDAKIALAGTTKPKKRKKYKEQVRYYKCEVCRGWHLTSWGRG